MIINLLILLIKILLVFVGLLSGFAVMTWFERRLIAGFQVRSGPNRVGPFGLLQPAADGLKLAMKEDIAIANRDRFVFTMAPMISMMAALVSFCIIPFGPDGLKIGGYAIPLHIAADAPVGFLFVLAVASIGIYGIVLAGWSSGSKYSLLGGMRSSAQMISYELAMGMALVSVLVYTGSLRPMDIMMHEGMWWKQFPALVIFFVCMIAETNRAPFDLVEAEQELVAGFHTEYSSFKFALFYMGEYVNMITFSALAVTLWFGGWRGPMAEHYPLLGVIYFIAKIAVFMFVYVWIRATLVRIRYDRLMALGWTLLLPSALIWAALTAVWVVLRP
ncbi:MAG TPA: NADH-quinone oxidoreductase subunit NuoH [Armatimonadota bacterium]|jgi:NADH-quinone oxidoreductase subunit H